MSNLPTQTTIAEKVAERIRDSFLELVPADEFQRMVEAQIKWFTTRPPKQYSHSGETESPLEKMLRDELREHYSAAVRRSVADWNGSWDQYGKATASDAVKKLVTENADALLASMMAGVVQAALQDFNQHLMQRLQGGQY